jgi:xylulokinase
VGTSGAKAALFDLSSFKLVNLAMQSYDSGPLQPSGMLWDAAATTIRAAVRGVEPSAIQGIGISAQMHGTVMIDRAGRVIEPVINWLDRRCDVPLQRYGDRTTIETMMDLIRGPEFGDLGIHVLSSGYLGPTLFYLKENDPALFERIDHVLLPGDFVRARLLGTGDRGSEPTNAFGTGIFNTRLGGWHDGVIEKLGLPRMILPDVHGSAEVAGGVPARVAVDLGLAANTPVVFGGGDNQMSLLGNGLLSASSPALINIGTSGQVSQVTLQYATQPGIDTRSYFYGSFAFVGATLGGGVSYATLREALAGREGRDVSYGEMNELASRVPPGADGLAFQPAGRSATGRPEGFAGRTELRDIGHLARAVLEGVILHLHALRPPTLAEGPGFMVGAGKGLQNGATWSQIAADVFDCPLKVTNFENAVWGAALLAALGTGAVSDAAAALSTIQYNREYVPNAADAARYRDLIAQRKGERGGGGASELQR